jgi:hypothetical protein
MRPLMKMFNKILKKLDLFVNEIFTGDPK